VALVHLGEGAAQDVSDVAEVPRTRVYDAVEELADRGLVDVKQTTPKRFWPTSTTTTSRHFRHEYDDRVERLRDALDGLESGTRSTEQRGVWTVVGRDTVTDRVVDLLNAAEEEVVFMTIEDLLAEEVVAALKRASDRGVTIWLADMEETTERMLRDAVPGATSFDSLWDWSETPAGRLLVVDEERTLVSALVPDRDGETSGLRDETAIWGTGAANSLVVVLRTVFIHQLDGERG
jgi:phosphatidylserine/phosphatidylglycerophosphate/cardiolipin synthase-like enzyme